MLKHRLLMEPSLITHLIEEFSTPIYVYDLRLIEEKILYMYKSFESLGFESSLYYSMKANNSPLILDFLRRYGIGFETVSFGEVQYLINMGVKPRNIMFTGCCVSPAILPRILELGIKINLDSFSQLESIVFNYGRNSDLGVRINPGLGAGHHDYTVTGGHSSKFGVPISMAESFVLKALNKGIRLRRLHMHIGSGFLSHDTLLNAVRKLFPLLNRFDWIQELDIGGGFGISYDSDEEFDFHGFIIKVNNILRESLGNRDITLLFEPGRYLVGRAGILVARVSEVKMVDNKLIIGLDTGFNHLIRPALYGTRHRILFPTKSNKKLRKGWVVGNVCENSDIFARDIPVPSDIRIGDPVLILDAGAYGYTMASFYNLHNLPKEIVLDLNGKARLSRKEISPLRIPGF